MLRPKPIAGLSPEEKAVAELAAYNAVPLVGIPVLGWSLGELLLFYLIESVFAGAWFFPKFLAGDGLNGDRAPRRRTAGNAGRLRRLRRWFRVVAVWVIYGAWIGVLGYPVLAVGVAATGGTAFITPVAVAVASVSAFAHHGVEYYRGYWRGDRTSAGALLELLGRVVVLFLTVMFGLVPAAVGAPTVTVVLLVVLKFGFDLVFAAFSDSVPLSTDDLAGWIGS